LDERIEKRRDACIDVAVTLEKRGLKRLPRILRRYAVGNYSEIWTEIKSFADAIMEGPDAVNKEFDGVFKAMLGDKLSTPEGLALVKAEIAAREVAGA
jgi:hypothetical protein